MTGALAGVVAGLLLTVRAGAAQQSTLLNPMFGDHAVLQRDQPLRVYGKASPGEQVSVSLGPVSGTARTDARGTWRVTLSAQGAGGPFMLTARAASGRAQSAQDVMIGDVFLCSGQSNMVMEVKYTANWAGEVRSSADNAIRMLTVPNAISNTPQDTFAGAVRWQVAGPGTVGDWSATCYYMARELRRSVPVPIGLVTSAWSGSNIRPWLSEQALRATGWYDDELDLLRFRTADPAQATHRWGARWEAWWRSQAGAGAGEPWALSSGSEGWRAAPDSLGAWETWGVPLLAEYNGMLWYRTTVRLSATQAAQAATVSLGIIDEVDQSWLNGEPIGYTSDWTTPRHYAVPAGRLRAGDNVIVINALDSYGAGGLVGPPSSRALRLANGETILLSGWQWRPVPGSAGWPPRAPWEATGGLTTIANAMIAPMGRFVFRAAVWYQGESNVGEPERYQRLLAALMADWRAVFTEGMPFLVVQLANYGHATMRPVESGWAGVREAQRLAVQADGRSGLAVAVDIGDRYDIHPTNKQEVGRRLARVARRVVYGEVIAPSGPVPTGARRVADAVVVSFGDAEGELVSYSAEGPIGFELCGAGRDSCRFAAARLDGTTVRLAAGTGEAVRVRYCWADSPVCTLYDRAGLPAGPFEVPVP